MTRSTTATISVSPKYSGTWADQGLWRIAGQAQLVEGNIPYWIVTPTQPAQYAVEDTTVAVETPDSEVVLESILMWLAVWFGSDVEETWLLESHNITLNEGKRCLAPFWDLADSTKSKLAQGLAQKVKLAVTTFDELSLVNETVIDDLRRLGFEVAVFAASPVCAQR